MSIKDKAAVIARITQVLHYRLGACMSTIPHYVDTAEVENAVVRLSMFLFLVLRDIPEHCSCTCAPMASSQ